MPAHYRRTHDPLVASAWAASASRHLRVGVGVCLVPARDPIVLAKQVASIDVMSGGRFVLGVGAGWNAEEIADHGVDPARRWAVMRERVLAMRAIWADDEAEFNGEHVSFGPLWSWPKPVQRPGPPIMVGGHGDRVIDRVLEYGDEWLVMPSPGRPPLGERIRLLHERADAAGRRDPGGVVPALRRRAGRSWSTSWWTAASSASTCRCRTRRPSRWSRRSAGSARRSRRSRDGGARQERSDVMDGILDGVRVLDLSRGTAGPMTAMLLADHGADVVRVEPPGGDGFGHWPGYVVWNRGKRRVVLDLSTPAGRDELLAMAAEADVLLETYRPGVTARLGIDYGTVGAINDRLVYATITGYGSDTPDAARPGIEWLVTARAGLQWDQGGWYGTRADHILGTDLTEPGFDVPEGAVQTGCREGPIFLAMPWASIGATLLAVTGISSGLYVRERTGRGQHFETSLVQAAIMANAMGWQRPGRMHPSYRLWYFDRRAPKGIFRTGDGRWLHQFAPIDHDFIRANAADADPADSGAVASGRPQVGSSGGYEDSVRFQALAHPETQRAMSTRTRDEWIEIFWAAGRAAQPILSAEEGLLDEPLEREGVIVELDDPELGPIRQVGHTYAFDGIANPAIRPRRLEPVTDRRRAGVVAHGATATPLGRRCRLPRWKGSSSSTSGWRSPAPTARRSSPTTVPP